MYFPSRQISRQQFHSAIHDRKGLMLTYFVQGLDGKFYVTLRVAVAVAVKVFVYFQPGRWIDLMFCDTDLTFLQEANIKWFINV